MRHWLLTNTTYGTWLPGNERGSVTSVRDRRPGDPDVVSRIEHDRPSEPWEEHLPGIQRSSTALLKCPPILLSQAKAELLLPQFQETAAHRNWELHAVAIMSSHFHMVVTVSGDPDPKRVLTDFKAYGSRILNRTYEKPLSKTWWTMRGSTRKLATLTARSAAIHYVLYKQPNPLIVWSAEHGRLI
ncbi:transposase [Bythopirellula goksoeyrii]|uniref:Transposase IS200 like protein n=1 Tax=Bythopirellula goksoeyrii TaxID=1400387 RepID=A0A5B9QSW2_9BACT|nr:transposase [Bythopirellula goksoeyrii]QEG37003.1 Transposase IS200 like protein [Bythopirellula goksoeyrii]